MKPLPQPFTGVIHPRPCIVKPHTIAANPKVRFLLNAKSISSLHVVEEAQEEEEEEEDEDEDEALEDDCSCRSAEESFQIDTHLQIGSGPYQQEAITCLQPIAEKPWVQSRAFNTKFYSAPNIESHINDSLSVDDSSLSTSSSILNPIDSSTRIRATGETVNMPKAIHSAKDTCIKDDCLLCVDDLLRCEPVEVTEVGTLPYPASSAIDFDGADAYHSRSIDTTASNANREYGTCRLLVEDYDEISENVLDNIPVLGIQRPQAHAVDAIEIVHVHDQNHGLEHWLEIYDF